MADLVTTLDRLEPQTGQLYMHMAQVFSKLVCVWLVTIWGNSYLPLDLDFNILQPVSMLYNTAHVRN